ncbi:MAG TPA: sigma-70 domain-containing protein [Polyangia bacterium]
MPLSPHLQPLFDALLAAHPNGLTLDELSEELSNKPVTYGDIDELVGALEGAGLDLEAPASVGHPDELAQVLSAVRALIAETGKKPSTDEIAARAGLTPTVVRRALRLGGSVTP